MLKRKLVNQGNNTIDTTYGNLFWLPYVENNNRSILKNFIA